MGTRDFIFNNPLAIGLYLLRKRNFLLSRMILVLSKCYEKSYEIKANLVR